MELARMTMESSLEDQMRSGVDLSVGEERVRKMSGGYCIVAGLSPYTCSLTSWEGGRRP